MEFLSPAWLLLLIPVGLAVVGYFILQLRRKKYVARFSNVSLLASVAPKRPGWRRHLTFALLIAGLAVLAFGAAQPTAAVHVPRDRATVMMAIDVSESMRADDVLPTRLQAAQQAAKQFAALAVGPDGAAATEPRWVTPHAIALELKTVRLRDFTVEAKGSPTLVCAPFALHGAAVADQDASARS